MAVNSGVIPKKRRAIGADRLGLVTEVNENVRMIERRGGADAHEFFSANLNERYAGIIVEVRNEVLCHHGPFAIGPAELTITAGHCQA
jgi:hypothetical protein